MDTEIKPDWILNLPSKVGGWEIGKYCGSGHSAAVFSSSKNGTKRAIKIFDPNFAKSQDPKIFKERLERHSRLIGKDHPNLVRIFDHGFDQNSNLYFLIMDHLPYQDLSKQLNDIERHQIPIIVSQLGSACEFLESLNLVHRDIKPANVAWDAQPSHSLYLNS